MDIRDSFLGALDPSERGALEQLGHLRQFRTGATLLNEGDPSNFVLLLVEGHVKVSSLTEHGTEVLLAIRGPGDILGELAAVDGGLRSARVLAIEAVSARVVSADDFTSFLRDHPRVMGVLLALISGRLRDADRKRTEFRGYDVPARIALRLLELGQTHGRQTSSGIALELRLSQEELAEWVGASREAVAKALRLLRERGAIATDRRSLTILRPELLHRLID
jgi:CRP-like cAMP-binding protein